MTSTRYIILWIYLDVDAKIDSAIGIAEKYFSNNIMNPNLQIILSSGCIAILWNNILVGRNLDMKSVTKKIQDEIGGCYVNYFEQGDNVGFFKKHAVYIGVILTVASLILTAVNIL